MTLKALSPLKPVSADAENGANVETSAPAPISTQELLTLIASMSQQLLAAQQQAAESQKLQAEANQKLASAIIETTKPREVVKTKKQLADEANDEMFKANERLFEKRKKQAITRSQDQCDHIAGSSSLSDERDLRGRTSILWHRTDAQAEVGICLVCQKYFYPTDTTYTDGHDYYYWRKKPSICKLSAAGNRIFTNPLEAMNVSFLRDTE